MSIEEIDNLIEEYELTFDEEPLVSYPQSIYSNVYVKLMKKALERGKPYTEEELDAVLNIGEDELI